MANWPNYKLKILGEKESVRLIEEMLRERSRWFISKLNEDYEYDDSVLEICGETPWGVRGMTDIILDIVVEKKMNLDFYESDIQYGSKFYGEWKKGEEIKWEEKDWHWNVVENKEGIYTEYLGLDEEEPSEEDGIIPF